MTTTAPRVTPMGTLRDRFLQLAERITTPLVPADYLDIVDPLRSGADLRGRIVAIHPETRDAVTLVIKPGRGLARSHARAVRPHRCRRRRRAPVARLLADLRYRTGRRLHRDHGQGDPRTARSATTWCDDATVGTIVQLDQAAGEFMLPAAAPRQDPVPHRGQRHHPGDGDAAQPGRADRRRRGRAQRPHSRRRDLRRRTARCWPRQGRIRLIEQHTDVDGMLDAAELDDLVSDLRRARRRGHAGRPACSTHSSSTGSTTACAERLHTERFRPTVVTAGDGGTVTFTKSATVRRRRRATRPCSTPAKRPAS